ncbi:F-box only protein 40 [Pimephales promelas]|uniref:F-box only protein 40 n=1 Tax=Pimephales promelas TaxID=90988 RepID=UPI001955C814|nr:F-box only protein 40 [Pimephales promelas]XP_039503303.1 F-box only protein 40 [Pimephales promelas]KAG1938779.1 F-box only protein [Pimephales promelas]KAG1938780.1 F-box only protein [Pimephales promelas]KAG1938781.1 F-box only protein [Pimephales promelas]KAG1938782.1 F-box only protein [Pimephales promelas]
MGKNRTTNSGLHAHCEKCHNQDCKIPIDISTSCVFIFCQLNCGAAFHLCKEDEHRLLCPKETVPCLNSGYGCPITMTRQKIAPHLEVCPASVITCTFEWNRWPVNETDTTFYRNAIQDPNCMSQLDLAMALRDQKLLFSSIQMKTLFPELVEKMEEPEVPLDGAVGGVDPESPNLPPEEMLENSLNGEEGQGLTQEERLALAKSKDVTCLENYEMWERMFAKEKEGCKQTVKNLDDKSCPIKDKEDPKVTPQNSNDDISGTGLAPWQDGVLDRLGKLNVAEYNMYLVHNGSMLINFGQLAACTPREKDFVYGNLEPIEVQTIHSFNFPTSYRPKRSHLKDPSKIVKKTHQNVDTSDLGIAIEKLPKANEIEATLLCALERELKGHQICESVGIDGLYVDCGTQTYDFHSAPFKSDASLANVVEDQPQNLHVQIQTECVTRRHNKSCSAFSYLCCNAFRRDEYPWHFRNVHGDIQSCLTGWFLQRCPLAYLGCTFSQKQFRPSKYKATVSYDTDLSTFILRPEVVPSLNKGVRIADSERKRARNLDSLSRLPFEVLQHIVSYLDSVSLGRLSQVSKLMREVCSTVLQQKGMVYLKWEKKTYSHGGFTWRARKKVWEFSTLHSPVDKWVFEDMPPMAEHLKVCPFYQKEIRSEPVPLPSMTDLQERRGEFQTLVNSVLTTVKSHRE